MKTIPNKDKGSNKKNFILKNIDSQNINKYINNNSNIITNINSNNENTSLIISPSNKILFKNGSNSNIFAKNIIKASSISPINNYNSNNNIDTKIKNNKIFNQEKNNNDNNFVNNYPNSNNSGIRNNNNNNNNIHENKISGNIIDSRKFSILDIQSSEKADELKLFLGNLNILKIK